VLAKVSPDSLYPLTPYHATPLNASLPLQCGVPFRSPLFLPFGAARLINSSCDWPTQASIGFHWRACWLPFKGWELPSLLLSSPLPLSCSDSSTNHQPSVNSLTPFHPNITWDLTVTPHII
jgi:hypothetical protein